MTKAQKEKMARRKKKYDDLRAMASRHAVQLSEHFTSVQIVTTHLEPEGGTMYICEGQGDILARIKAAEVWVKMANEIYLGNPS